MHGTVPTRRVRVFALVSRNLDSVGYRGRFAAGLEPDESPYGFHLAEKFGFDLTFSRAASGRPVSELLHRVVARICGFDVLHAWKNRKALNDCDVIWTMSERDWLAVAALQRLGVVKPTPLIANSIWLFDRWPKLSAIRRAILRNLARVPQVCAVHSAGSLSVARRVLPESVKTRLIPFGIALSTFQIEEPRLPGPRGRPLKILSIGNDRTRDWNTLLAAVGNDPGFEVRIICRWLPKDLDGRYGNVTIERQMAPFDFGRIYHEADLTIVTLSRNVFSGITVILESVATGTPVVASRTGGGPTYFAEDEVTFVEPGDPAALKRALLDTSREEFAERARRAQARFKSEDYSTAGMVGRYAAKTEAVLRLQRREMATATGGRAQLASTHPRSPAVAHPAA